MTGYTRNDTTNNIANGNVINASDLDGEFDAIQTAFDVSTGHAHDGTVGEGAPIEVLGPSQDVVVTATVIRPKTDNAVDLGSSSLEFKDLYIDGTANIDSLVADTADINGGTIDGATIGGSSAAAGTFTTATATTGNITTVNATTVDTTNIEVTTLKAKDGTAAGSIADTTGVVTLASSVLTTTDINGGTIDGTTIGGSSPAVGTFTTANATTVDTTNIEVTTLKAKDGTSAGSIADSTGVVTLASSVLTSTDINGGTIDGTVIGGSTPAAISGTTISGTTASFTAAQNTDGQIRIGNSTTRASGNKYGIRFADSSFETNAAIYAEQTSSGNNASSLVFGTNAGTGGIQLTSATERMRIDSSGNVGIGTTSPTADLSVGSATSSSGDVHLRTSKTTFELTPSNSDAGGMDINVGFVAGGQGPLKFSIGGTERMRIDSSGNLGLGVTPSAWASTTKALEFGYGSIASNSDGATYVGGNSFLNASSAWVYKTTSAASLYQTSSGTHLWFTAPSGTAGNAISFTQAMTLDASGNLLVGTTSDIGAKLVVKSSASAGALNAIIATNSSNTVLLQVRDDGLITTSTAGAGPYALTTASAANMVVTSGGEFRRSTSSLKYKANVENAIHGLSEVLALRPVTYKGNNDGDTVFGGLIAEEVHEAGLTEFVQYAEDGSPDALAYGNMVSLCIKAIQELKAEVDSLRAQLNP